MLQGREAPARNPRAGMQRNKDSLTKFQLQEDTSGHRPIMVASHLDVQLGQSESLGKTRHLLQFVYLVGKVTESRGRGWLHFCRSNNANTWYVLGRTQFETYFAKYNSMG